MSVLAPNKFSTIDLTFDPGLYRTPEQAYDAAADGQYVALLIRLLNRRRNRRRHIAAIREAFPSPSGLIAAAIARLESRRPIRFHRTLEFQASGFPHFHLIVDLPFAFKPFVQALWRSIAGSSVCWCKPVRNPVAVACYFTKYNPLPAWALQRKSRSIKRYSVSRGFFGEQIAPPTKGTPPKAKIVRRRRTMRDVLRNCMQSTILSEDIREGARPYTSECIYRFFPVPWKEAKQLLLMRGASELNSWSVESRDLTRSELDQLKAAIMQRGRLGFRRMESSVGDPELPRAGELLKPPLGPVIPDSRS